MFRDIKIVLFDADDTLWGNETFFRDAEKRFERMLSEYGEASEIHQKLYQKEIENLAHYGYGVKGFVLSMVECALEISNHKVSSNIIAEILTIGKEMLNEPVEVIDGVEEVLKRLLGNYKIIVETFIVQVWLSILIK